MESDSDLVRRVFQACRELSIRTGRPVSPDGHLVGSLGELIAAEQLGLELQPPSNHGFDAIGPEGERVEIKATTRGSVSISSVKSKAERLVVVKFDGEGSGTIVFDGPFEVGWKAAGKPQRNGQRRVSLRSLVQG